MGETWGCIYKTGHTCQSHLVFTCTRRRGITALPPPWWIPLPQEMSILGGEKNLQLFIHYSTLSFALSLSLYQPSVSLSAFIVGFRVTFPNEALCQNGTGTSTNTSKFKMRHHEGQTSIADWCHIKHSLWEEKISPWTGFCQLFP